jgi:hypothetical protein
MKIEDLLKMGMGECVEWLIKNQDDFELAKKPMFENFDEFEKLVGYKVTTEFIGGFGAARMIDK